MDITKEYSKAYVEVLEVLKYLKEEEYKRVPKERIDIYDKFKDNDYYFEIDPEQELDTQLSSKTKAVLSNLFIRYISNESDRVEIFAKERKNIYEEELAKIQNVKLNPLFEKANKTKEVIEENQTLIVYKKNSFLKKVLNKIKTFLKQGGINRWKYHMRK